MYARGEPVLSISLPILLQPVPQQLELHFHQAVTATSRPALSAQPRGTTRSQPPPRHPPVPSSSLTGDSSHIRRATSTVLLSHPGASCHPRKGGCSVPQPFGMPCKVPAPGEETPGASSRLWQCPEAGGELGEPSKGAGTTRAALPSPRTCKTLTVVLGRAKNHRLGRSPEDRQPGDRSPPRGAQAGTGGHKKPSPSQICSHLRAGTTLGERRRGASAHPSSPRSDVNENLRQVCDVSHDASRPAPEPSRCQPPKTGGSTAPSGPPAGRAPRGVNACRGWWQKGGHGGNCS